MRRQSISVRMALASIAPVMLVVLAIVSTFWRGRVQDLEDSHRQRLEMLAHQVALFSAYDLFSGNSASLQSVVQEIQRDPGVLSVEIFDTDNHRVASSGTTSKQTLEVLADASYAAQQKMLDIDVRVEKIYPAVLPILDLFTTGEMPTATPPIALGSAVIKVSRQELNDRERSALLTAVWVGVLGILLGGLLAFRLGNWVVRPLLRVSQMVKRIGQGDFSIPAPVAGSDPLQELQASLNQMAQRLAWSRDELERQVESVTRELRLKKEQAESATQAKSRFLAAASHDLRQPSHALGMFVARLGQLPMEPQMRHLVNNLEVSVLAMQDLLDGLLDLSRLDSGNVQVRMGPVDLNEILESVSSALQTMAETKGLRLRIRPTQLWVRSDAMLLQRMIINLVTNAIRYTEHGSVLVACRSHLQGQRVRIEICDSGIGIAPEHHEDIFKEFYQLENSTGHRNFGLGLGLNIVQRSGALLGHDIALRSNIGCGTKFTILAEASPPLAPEPRVAEKLEPAVGDLYGMHILLIEDNRSVREAVKGLLQSWGCSVHLAACQTEALTQLQAHGVPAVILSDYHLGVVETGIDCILALRAAAGTDIPACLMSGDTHEEFLKAVKAEELPLLHKPVRPAKLRSLLRHMQT